MVINLLITSSVHSQLPEENDTARYHVDLVIDMFGLCKQALSSRILKYSKIEEFCYHCLAPMSRDNKREHLEGCRSGDPKLVFPVSGQRKRYQPNAQSYPTQVVEIMRWTRTAKKKRGSLLTQKKFFFSLFFPGFWMF